MDLAIEKMTEKEKQEEAFLSLKRLNEGIAQTTNGYLLTGKELVNQLDYGLWKHCASHIKTKEDWVREYCPFKKAQADHYKRVYKKFKDRIGDRVISFNRLLEALPVTNNDNIEKIIIEAETLSKEGWRNNIRGKKGLITSDECEHEETEAFSRCKKCGAWLKL